MAKGIAECTCERCGKAFTMVKRTCYNSADAASWREWAQDHYTVCPDCYAEQKAAEMLRTHDEVEMKYSEYKNHYEKCKTKPDSYNKVLKTIIVYVPKKADEKKEEAASADTYDKLRAAVNERNDDLIPYISDSAASDAVLEETAKIWDSGESLSAAIAPHGTVTVAGVSHNMYKIKDAWNAAHPEAQPIQYMGMEPLA